MENAVRNLDSIGLMYLNLVQAIPDIVYVLDDRGKFVYLNAAVSSLGFSATELLGRHFSDIIHPEDRAAVSRDEVLKTLRGTTTGDAGSPRLFDERRSGARMTRNLEVRLVCKGPDECIDPEANQENRPNLSYRYASVNAYGELAAAALPFSDLAGSSLCTVGIIRDITEAKEKEKALREALAARDILLKEVHHRVKNNLQVVSSLLSLHESEIEDEAARGVFRDCRTQIHSMAMVHEALYMRESLTGVDMKAYLARLLRHLAEIYEGGRREIVSEVNASAPCILDVDRAVTVALVVNELVSNAYKYAFAPGLPGEIQVSFSAESDAWVLDVSDRKSGVVAAPSPEPSMRRAGGIGNDLIEALAMQLRGQIERFFTDGTTVRLRFPLSPS